MNVTKMEGCGNDFVVVDMKEIEKWDLSELSIKVCDRHYGVGADGLICVKRDPLEFIYYNSDGSYSSFCGNGIRCFAKYVVIKNIVKSNEFFVICDQWSVLCKVEDERVTIIMPEEAIVEKDDDILIVCGSKHKIVEVKNLENVNKMQSGEYNLNYIQCINEDIISVRTIERGAGLTLACGSGSYASALKMKKMKKISDKLIVRNVGGEIEVDLKKKSLSGPANLIFDCQWNVTA